MLGSEVRGEPRGRRWIGRRRGRWLLAAALAASSFGISCLLEAELDEAGAFRPPNLLFDADPRVQLRSLAHGSSPYGRNPSHPNLANYINPPVRLLAAALTGTGWVELPERDLRRRIGLLVVPLASGLKAALAFALFAALGFTTLEASLAAILASGSFSQLVFGSMPDHWALSGLALALAHLLVVDVVRRHGKVRWWAWIAVGAAAAGITVTNLLAVAALLGAAVWTARGELRAVALPVAKATAASALLTYLYAAVANRIYGVRQLTRPGGMRKWIGMFFHRDWLLRLASFPAAAAAGLAPAGVLVAGAGSGPGEEGEPLLLTLESSPPALAPGGPLGWILVALAAAGCVRGLRGAPVLRAATLGALAVLTFNGVFHAAWGSEYFLYSQHYHLSVVLLVTAGALGGGRRRPLAAILFGALVAAVVVNNGLVVHDMLSLLSSRAPRS